jgi:hypothetical protein
MKRISFSGSVLLLHINCDAVKWQMVVSSALTQRWNQTYFLFHCSPDW